MIDAVGKPTVYYLDKLGHKLALNECQNEMQLKGLSYLRDFVLNILKDTSWKDHRPIKYSKINLLKIQAVL